MELYNELLSVVTSMETDVKKFYNKGNNQASIRARKDLQKIKDLAQQLRKDISSTKKAMPPKRRKNKKEE
jgi:hypothetical protein